MGSFIAYLVGEWILTAAKQVTEIFLWDNATFELLLFPLRVTRTTWPPRTLHQGSTLDQKAHVLNCLQGWETPVECPSALWPQHWWVTRVAPNSPSGGSLSLLPLGMSLCLENWPVILITSLVTAWNLGSNPLFSASSQPAKSGTDKAITVPTVLCIKVRNK